MDNKNKSYLSPKYKVPANSSRFFSNFSEAVSQPLGSVLLAWDETQKIVTNQEYAPELIKYDSQYCTSVSAIGGKLTLPTLAYIDQVLRYTKESPVVIDIGCGQGEFVNELRSRGIDASGFDPVLRSTSPWLRSRLWESSDSPGDLYVLRCVLPHIQSPWEFLAQISKSSPGCLVLIEFQRLEWILKHKVWYQISHDHVNLFSFEDFLLRYRVIDSGTLSNGEWGWVLVDPSKFIDPEVVAPEEYDSHFKELFSEKTSFLEKVSNLERPIAIWGAAGKGIVLAHSFTNNILAIDADFHRWGCFLEASGAEVLSPSEVFSLEAETLILVGNPNHLEQVKIYVRERFEVKLPTELRGLSQ